MPEIDVPSVPPQGASTSYTLINLVGATVGDIVLTSRATADANKRWKMQANGTMIWGDGAGSFDVALVRDAANILAIQNGSAAQAFRVYGAVIGPKFLSLAHDGTNGGTVYAQSGFLVLGSTGGDIYFQHTGVANRWQMTSTGNWVAVTDNAYDIGALGATRPRSIYWATSALSSDGTVANPSYSFASALTTGLHLSNPDILVSISGVDKAQISSSGVTIPDGASFGFAVGTLPGGPNVRLWRGGAGILQQSNSGSAQASYLYNTTDSDTAPVNFERGIWAWRTNLLVFGTEKSGSGTARGIDFMTGNVGRWTIGATTGHFTADVDNATDIGTSGAFRPRSIYAATQFLAPSTGSAATPAYSFDGLTNYGIFGASAGTYLGFTVAGTTRFIMQADRLFMRSVGNIAWDNGDIFSTVSLQLQRDAANVMAQVNGASAQEFRIYGTNVGPKYLQLSHSGTGATIGEVSGGSGINFATGGTIRWIIQNAGHLTTNADNTYDIGAAGATRPRDVYVGTSVRVGTNPAGAGTLRMPYGNGLYARNNANGADILVADTVTVNSVADIVKIGTSNSNGVILYRRSGAGAPTASDIAASEWCLWRDTSGATTKLYYNNAGTLQSVALT